MRVLLDTNFLICCSKQKIDFDSLADELFEENVEWIIPEEVLIELKNFSERKGEKVKDRDAAKFALEYLTSIDFKKVKLNCEDVDDGIVDFVKNSDFILATLDKELKRRANVKNLVIRSKSYLKVV